MRETSLEDLFRHLSLTFGRPLSEDERALLEPLSAQERQSLRDVSIPHVEGLESSVRRVTQSQNVFFSVIDSVVVRLDFVIVQFCLLYFMVFFVGEPNYFRQQSVYNGIYFLGLLCYYRYYHSALFGVQSERLVRFDEAVVAKITNLFNVSSERVRQFLPRHTAGSGRESLLIFNGRPWSDYVSIMNGTYLFFMWFLLSFITSYNKPGDSRFLLGVLHLYSIVSVGSLIWDDWELFFKYISREEIRDFSQGHRLFPLKGFWAALKGCRTVLSTVPKRGWADFLLPFGKGSTVSQKWIFADFLLIVLHCCSDGIAQEEVNKAIKRIQGQPRVRNKERKGQEYQGFFGRCRWIYTNRNQVSQLISRAGMNALSGRQLNSLLNYAMQLNSDEATVDADFKVDILRRLFQLFSSGRCQQIIPVMYEKTMGKKHIDEAYIIQIVSEVANQCVNNDEILLYMAQMIDTSFDAFVHQPSRSSETTVKKLIRFLLYSEVFKTRPDLRLRRIEQFNDPKTSEENLLILLIRDFARIMYFHSSDGYYRVDILNFIGSIFAALSKVDLVVTSERQQVVSSVFRDLSSYFLKPSRPGENGKSFARICKSLSGLSDEDCHIESSLFWFEFLSFVNGVFMESGVIDDACSPHFVKFVVSKVVEYGGEETISRILGKSGVSTDGLMEKKMWRTRTPSNKIEMLYSLFYSLSLLLRYNYIEMFRESFQSSEDFSLFFKQKFSVDMSVKEEKKSLYQSILSGLDLSTRFVDSSLCFLDKVENEEKQQVYKDLSVEDYGERKRSSILFLAFLFDYSGRNRVIASDWIARLMYGNVLGNPGFVKWCLMGLNSILLFLSLSIGFFDFSRRRKWYQNILNLTYSVYFLLTRSIVQLPRLLWLSVQLVFLVLGNLLYRAGRLRILVFSSCLLGALACVNALAISSYLVPVLACFFYYAFKLVSQVILPCLGVDPNLSLFCPLVINGSTASDAFSSLPHRINSADSEVLSQQQLRDDDLDSSGVVVSP